MFGVMGMPVPAARKQLIVRLVEQRFVPERVKFAVAPLEQVVRKRSDGQFSSMHAQQVAVTVNSARRPVGPGGPTKVGALVT